MHIHAHIFMYKCIHVNVYENIYIYIHIHVCKEIFTYIGALNKSIWSRDGRMILVGDAHSLRINTYANIHKNNYIYNHIYVLHIGALNKSIWSRDGRMILVGDAHLFTYKYICEYP
jgi:hypothetical protein